MSNDEQFDHPRSRRTRFGWFLLLWVAGVVALAMATWVIKQLIGG